MSANSSTARQITFSSPPTNLHRSATEPFTNAKRPHLETPERSTQKSHEHTIDLEKILQRQYKKVVEVFKNEIHKAVGSIEDKVEKVAKNLAIVKTRQKAIDRQFREFESELSSKLSSDPGASKVWRRMY